MSGESRRTSTLTSVQAPPAPENCIWTATIATSGSPQREFHLKRKRAQSGQNLGRHRRIYARARAGRVGLDTARPVQAQEFWASFPDDDRLEGRNQTAELTTPADRLGLGRAFLVLLNPYLFCNRRLGNRDVAILKRIDGVGQLPC